MKDLENAKKMLAEGYTLVLSRKDTTYTSKRRGVGTLLEYAEKKADLSGFCAADRVVGKGAAFLYIILGVSAVYAEVISEGAYELLLKNGIFVAYGTLVKRIINRTGDGFCPIEEAVFSENEPSRALALIKEKYNDLQKL